MNDSGYVPRHAGPFPGDEPERPAFGPDSELFNRLVAYSRRSRRGVVVRLDERRAMREALRPVRTDHFGGEAA